jgi:hypothetical protein
MALTTLSFTIFYSAVETKYLYSLVQTVVRAPNFSTPPLGLRMSFSEILNSNFVSFTNKPKQAKHKTNAKRTSQPIGCVHTCKSTNAFPRGQLPKWQILFEKLSLVRMNSLSDIHLCHSPLSELQPLSLILDIQNRCKAAFTQCLVH